MNELSICKNEGMNIREANSTDFARMAEIYNSYIGKATMDLETKTSEYFQEIIKKQSPNEGLYIAENQDFVIGWGIIKKYSDREGYARAAETSVYIDSDYIGEGYGKAMKSFLISKAEEKGYKHLVAKIWANNTTSISYNEKFGYEIVGTQRKIGYVDGKWIDVVIMQYVFPD